jgi:hypothetical protein
MGNSLFSIAGGWGWGLIFRLMKIKILTALILVAGGKITVMAQGPYEVPIYVDSATNYSPDRYTIYAGMTGGNSPNTTIVPYNFDTGAPNMFSTLGGEGFTATGNFAFAQALTYNYYEDPVSVTLGDNSGNAIVSTASGVNVASVVSITNGGTTTNTSNGPLSDSTYGDFGAGLYGNSTLATILTQFPLGAGLQPGYLVNVAGVSSGSGTLTIGLSAAAIAAAENAPGAIVMQLSLSGNMIPTTGGNLINGYNKAQVANATVTLTTSGTISNTMPLVLDTGGGTNVAIYSTGFGPDSSGNGTVNLSYDGQTILQDTDTTPYGGNVDVINDISGGTRINPGGAAIYENYEVMFVLSTDSNPGEVILVPTTVPEPAESTLLALGVAGVFCMWRRRGWK